MKLGRTIVCDFGLGRIACLLVALGLASGCATDALRSSTATFVVVRHAEKASDDLRDPTLSEAGTARARALATLLQREPVIATYATRYRRTQLTAAPSAQAAQVAVTTYDADLTAEEFARQLRTAHRAGTVLVVGHSNTAPAIAAALCGCAVPPMTETTFDTIHRIRIRANAAPELQTSRY